MLPASIPTDIPHAQQIAMLDSLLRDAEAAGQGVQLETWHHFADGLVARTIFIPAGAHLTGAAHKHEHLNICFGDIDVLTAAGPQRFTGYHVIPSLPGTQRAGRAWADTWWTTVHLNPGNERDIAALEDALVLDADKLQSRRTLPTAKPCEVLV